MRRKFILIGGMLFLIAQLAMADVLIDAYKVDGFSSDYLEVGSTVKVTVKYSRSGAGNIVGAKFYFDYDTAYLDVIDESAISDNLAGSLTSKTNPNFTPAPGQVRYQRDAAGGAGLPLASGTIPCFTITFHVKQTESNAGTRNILHWLTPLADNVKLVAPGGVNITGTVNPLQDAVLRISADPTFAGINNVVNPATGNTLNLSWPSAATDLNEGAATYYEGHGGTHDGAGLRFNIYRNPRSAPTPPAGRIVPEHNAFTYTDTGLDDGTRYYYKVYAQDNCTPVHNEDANSAVRNAIPTDHTAPNPPTGFSAGSGNQELRLNWSHDGGDIGTTGGYLVIRYLSDPGAARPPLMSASNNDPSDFGVEHGTPYPVGTEIGGGKAIYNDRGMSPVDRGTDLPNGHLINGTTYYYQVFAYDQTEGSPRQQGKNYSVSANTSGTPGVAPDALTNFYAISSPEAGKISLFWDKQSKEWYGGVVFWYTTDAEKKWDWYKTWGDPASGALSVNATGDLLPAGSDWLNLRDSGKIGILAVYKTDPAIPAGAQEALVLTRDLAGNTLDLSKVYFVKALAYNATGVDFPTDPAAINASVLSGRAFSPIKLAASLPAGGGGVGGPLTFHLLPSATDRLVVNSITIPSGMTITRASQLIDLVNSKAGRNIVIVLSRWDPATGTAVGRKPDGEGTDFTLEPGVGYQLYVNQDFILNLP